MIRLIPLLALTFLGAGSAQADSIDELIAVLKDPAKETSAKTEACLQINSLHEKALNLRAARAIPVLAGLLEHKEPSLRQLAINVINDLARGYDSPISRGKEVVPALLKAMHDTDPPTRGAAIRTMARIHPASAVAFPALLEALDDQNVNILGTVSRAITEYGLESASLVPEIRKRFEAAKGERRVMFAALLWELTRDAEATLPVLLESLKQANRDNHSPTFDAQFTVGHIGAEALPEVRKLLNDPNEGDRLSGLHALSFMNRDARPAIPQLLKALGDKSSEVRAQAAFALFLAGPLSPSTVPALKEALKDEESRTRRNVVNALARVQPSTKEASLALATALNDAEAEVRSAVAGALGRIGDTRREVVEALRKALKDTDDRTRASAAGALGQLGFVEEAIPVLVPLLRNEEASYWAANALGELGPEAAPALDALFELAKTDRHIFHNLAGLGAVAVPRLRQALTDKDDAIRKGAAAALGYMGPDAKAAYADLVKLLTDSNEEVRVSAATSLGRLGPLAQRAAEDLTRALADSEAEVRYQVVRALGTIESRDPMVIRGLAVLLKDTEEPIRVAAALSLASLGADAKDVTPKLVEMLKRSTGESRLALAYAIARLDAKHPSGMPLLQTAIKDRTWFRMVGMHLEVAEIGPSARAQLPSLVEALKERDQKVREQSAWLIGTIGPGRAEVAALLRGLDDPSERVRLAIVAALARARADDLKPAHEALLRLLPDSSADLGVGAASALLKADSSSKEARQKLCEHFSMLLAVSFGGEHESRAAMRRRYEDHFALLELLGPDARPAEKYLKRLAKTHADQKVREQAERLLNRLQKTSP